MIIEHMIQQEKHYAVIAPLLALAGAFAHPVASTLLPLALFFIFYWRRMEFARLIALRAADLAFSVQLYLVIASLLLALYLSNVPTTLEQAQGISTSITLLLLAFFITSLLIAIIYAFRGKVFRYPLSLRIAERVFDTIQKRQQSR